MPETSDTFPTGETADTSNEQVAVMEDMEAVDQDVAAAVQVTEDEVNALLKSIEEEEAAPVAAE